MSELQAQDRLTGAPNVAGRHVLRIGRYVGVSIVGIVIAISAAVVVIQVGSDTEVASVSPPVVRTQAGSAAAPAIGVPGLTPAQVADAARWTALAQSLATTPGLSAAQVADAARWTALAQSLATTPDLSAAQVADAARWTALAQSLATG